MKNGEQIAAFSVGTIYAITRKADNKLLILKFVGCDTEGNPVFVRQMLENGKQSSNNKVCYDIVCSEMHIPLSNISCWETAEWFDVYDNLQKARNMLRAWQPGTANYFNKNGFCIGTTKEAGNNQEE